MAIPKCNILLTSGKGRHFWMTQSPSKMWQKNWLTSDSNHASISARQKSCSRWRMDLAWNWWWNVINGHLGGPLGYISHKYINIVSTKFAIALKFTAHNKEMRYICKAKKIHLIETLSSLRPGFQLTTIRTHSHLSLLGNLVPDVNYSNPG